MHVCAYISVREAVSHGKSEGLTLLLRFGTHSLVIIAFLCYLHKYQCYRHSSQC